MSDRHFAHWPKGLPRHMTIPETDLFHNVEVSARRYPAKPFLVFYDTQISYAEFKDEAERIAGWLQQGGQHHTHRQQGDQCNQQCGQIVERRVTRCRGCLHRGGRL